MENNIFGSSSENDKQSIENGFKVNLEYAESLQKEKEEPQSIKGAIFEWLEIMVGTIIAVVVIFGLLFRVVTIDGPSMQNTLFNGERVIISNFAYKAKPGDIVVISRNTENDAQKETEANNPIIKRVIAVGGQTVDIDFQKGIVYVDGKALKEDYTSTPTYDKYEVDFPLTLPEGSVFVLGDNRANSLDSRSASIGENGIIDERYILGHAVFRLFPFERIGRLDNK